MSSIVKYYEIIKTPVITEQSLALVDSENKYTFKVDKRANKVEIKKAIETIYNVTVVAVNTTVVKPKPKRMGRYEGFTTGYKKAIVKLADGNKIDAFAV